MDSDAKKDIERSPMRADFVSEVIETNEETRRVTMRFLPDPRRYTEIEKNGQTLYVDKYLKTAFALKDMADAFVPDLPCYALSSAIDSTEDYADQRLDALESERISGSYVPPKETPLPHSNLLNNQKSRQVGFLSVDICGSTGLRLLGASEFDKAYGIFLRELGTVVGQFNGTILKTKGDGFIAVIDHPSFTNACDAIIDMGLSILTVLHLSVNPVLARDGLPKLNIRIGADYGSAVFRNLIVPATGFNSPDVSSDALNRAVKIEETCEKNEFRIGRCLYELIHVHWLERATEIEPSESIAGGEDYQLYRIK